MTQERTNINRFTNPEDLPHVMLSYELAAFMGASLDRTTEKLRRRLIPGGKKIGGEWRIAKAPFLSWWYSDGLREAQ